MSRQQKAQDFTKDPQTAQFKEQIETNEKLDELVELLKKKIAELSELKRTVEENKKRFEVRVGKRGKRGKTGHNPTNEELVALIAPLIPNTKNGKDGADGISPDEEDIIRKVLASIELPQVDQDAVIEEIIKQIPQTGEAVRDALELLQEDERLDKSAVKGIDKIEKDIKEVQSRPVNYRGGGARHAHMIHTDTTNFDTNLSSDDDTVQKALDTIDNLSLGHTPEGTAVLSTGEGGGSKFLREDGDGTSSWQTIPAGAVDVVSNVATDTILGRDTAGSGDSEELTPAAVRTLINVEDGATADQDLSGLLPKAGGTMTGNIALNGNYLSGDGGDEGVFVDSSGDVGIGTLSPSAKLHISEGNLELDNTTNANQFGTITKGGNRFIHDFNYGDNGSVTTSGFNTFIGDGVGNFTMGSGATGAHEASYNTIIGNGAFISNTRGYSNVALGYIALASNTTGDGNFALGNNSLQLITNGRENIAIGRFAGTYIANGSSANTTGDFSIFLGTNAKALADNNQNQIVIGYNATGIGSNSVVLGNDSIVTTALKGNVGIGTTTPTAKLHVDQSSTTAEIPVLTLDQADISEEMISFETTIGTGNAIEAVGAKTLTTTHFIKVTLPGGLTRYIPAGTIA